MKISSIYEQVLNESNDKLFYHGSPYTFDKFDFDRIGSGDGLSKFGHGLYFADDIDTAVYYAKELSIGDLRKEGFNLYSVRIYNLDSFYEWEDETPSFVAECVIRKLYRMDKRDDADQIQQEFEEYGKYWELKNMYETLKHILGSAKATSEMLSICGVGGVIGKSPAHKSNIYTVYDDSLIRIINSQKLK